MTLQYRLKKLLNIRAFIAKLLLKLPQSFFPNYRVIISPILIENNRRTLNFYNETLEMSFEADSLSSCSDNDDDDDHFHRCCEECFQISAYEENSLELENFDEKEMPQIYSTPKKNLSPSSSSSPTEFETYSIDYYKALIAPLRMITVREITSVKLKPLSELDIPKTPEVHDMMEVLRKRFAAMHSLSSSSYFKEISDSTDDNDEISSSWGLKNDGTVIQLVNK